MPSPLALKLAGLALNRTGVGRLIGRRYRGVGGIYILHGLVENPADHLHDHLHTSVRLLDATIRRFRRKGIDIVTLDEALARLEQPAPRPFVAFTFDDGYRNNLDVALPLFRRHEAPFTVFVTTAFLDRSLDVWWAGLAEAVKRADVIRPPGFDAPLPARSFSEKVRAYRTIGRAVDAGRLPVEALGDFLRKQGVSVRDLLDRDALDEPELKRLASSPLVEIGGHTTSHPALAMLGEAEARADILSNKHHLEGLTGRPVRHLAYPYGNSAACGTREFALARELGFSSAVTTRLGSLFPAHAAAPTALPRLRMFSGAESLDLVEAGQSGVIAALATRFGAPVVTA